MTWLLTGGAGYIGSHIACALRDTGRDVVVLDDLSTGHPHRLPTAVPLIQASVLDREAVVQALLRHRVTGVIHLAGKKSVSESVAHPRYYHEQNVVGLRRLLEAVRAADVTRLVFSSSAAVYGAAATDVIDETTPTTPISPYGATKLAGEGLVRRAGLVTGMGWLALRYFNVAGAGAQHLGDTSVANLIPMVFQALERGRRPQIFGADYATSDGSCVRDYIHVADVAAAHVTAAQHLEADHASSVYNIGRGVGVSVKEVLHAIRCATGHSFEPEVVSRRPGDPPRW
jgi:UDP-glucose 4-epimerase